MDRHYRCAWCKSTNTYYLRTRYWEEDEYHPGDDTMTPMDEEWWCRNCDDGFIVPLDEDEHEDDHAAE